MTDQTFQNYLFGKFREWEETTPKRRASFTAFARWLSDNSYKINVNQQLVDQWMNGAIPKDKKYVLIIAEKLGSEVYEVLGIEKPDENVIYIQTQITKVGDKMAKKIRDEIAEYLEKKKDK